MSTTQGVRAGRLLIAVGACLLLASQGQALVNTERPGSLLIFPKVVNDGTRHTAIQISNTTNSFQQVRCFYISGDTCSEIDFDLHLTKQQPTFWYVSEGRGLFSGPPGLPPGAIPPVPPGFVGALLCATVDQNSFPAPRNSLVGEATLYGPGNNSSKYNGISFFANAGSGTTNTLPLNGTVYSACPAAVRVNFPNPAAPDPGIVSSGLWGQCSITRSACSSAIDCPVGETCLDGICPNGDLCGTGGAPPCAGSAVCSALTGSVTTVTVLPCNINLDNLVPTRLALTFEGTDGHELPFSGSKNVSCWETFTINTGRPCANAYGEACLTAPPGASDFMTVNIKSGSGGPFVAVAETFHFDATGLNSASAGVNVHMAAGTCAAPAVNLGQACNNDSDCISGGVGSCAAPAGGAVITLPGN